ncbi:Uncharacterised protein [Mycobacteroides abscessus subsp. abscessus]|nr:Uncharacterised protein [Mycobacteroides abscessus subsp. abscessus]SIC66974.1 Uncharacterised protein [Mycobacteroides abscessus subsp. abscessus]SID24768.1 Uncharacterised protein [Mycobacteroides abscessus subsp. abscessus]SID41226.1 Uncharacterised protein [Mycobacteroides abscessus subsp. abscessus]SID43056.1 Uncharacterised protein [Mycobacteroides abscessus subsp. abscessus]
MPVIARVLAEFLIEDGFDHRLGDRLSSPSGPVSATPASRAWCANSRATSNSSTSRHSGISITAVAACSSAFCDGVTATTVSVIKRPFRPRHTGGRQAAYTVIATLPAGHPAAAALSRWAERSAGCLLGGRVAEAYGIVMPPPGHRASDARVSPASERDIGFLALHVYVYIRYYRYQKPCVRGRGILL